MSYLQLIHLFNQPTNQPAFLSSTYSVESQFTMKVINDILVVSHDTWEHREGTSSPAGGSRVEEYEKNAVTDNFPKEITVR